MHAIAMSSAASGLFRALIRRVGERADRILLSDIRSHDWQSLTFSGERHSILLRVNGEGAGSIVHKLISGLEDAEFAIPGQIVADISAAEHEREADGSLTVAIEALTITE